MHPIMIKPLFIFCAALLSCVFLCPQWSRAQQSAANADPELEKILSGAVGLRDKPIALAQYFTQYDNDPILSSSQDLPRLERFYFESASAYHNLAIIYRNNKPNEFLTTAKQYWLRYISWHDGVTASNSDSLAKAGAKDRINTSVEDLLRLVNDLEGGAAAETLIESGQIDPNYMNDNVVELRLTYVELCVSSHATSAAGSSSCDCGTIRQAFLHDTTQWISTFPLRPSRKSYFMHEIATIQATSCTI